MILTENEAKTKICCGPLCIAATMEGANPCVASECMAWRWVFDATGHHSMKQIAPPSECPDCKKARIIHGDNTTMITTCASCDDEGMIGHYERAGFCGLVGKPH